MPKIKDWSNVTIKVDADDFYLRELNKYNMISKNINVT